MHRNIRKALNEASKKLSSGELPIILSNLTSYFVLIPKTDLETLEYYPQNMQEAIDAKGFFGLATSRNMSVLETHDIYSTRDASAKLYMIMKSEIEFGIYCVGT